MLFGITKIDTVKQSDLFHFKGENAPSNILANDIGDRMLILDAEDKATCLMGQETSIGKSLEMAGSASLLCRIISCSKIKTRIISYLLEYYNDSLVMLQVISLVKLRGVVG